MRIFWGVGVIGLLALMAYAVLLFLIGGALVLAFVLIKELVTDPLIERWERGRP